jgi:hypothetical protein
MTDHGFKVPFNASVSTSPLIRRTRNSKIEKVKSNYYSLFENQNVSAFPSPVSSVRQSFTTPVSAVRQSFPSPFSSVRQGDYYSHWSSPVPGNGAVPEELKQVKDLENKVTTYGQRLKKSQDQITSKDALLSDINERNLKLRDQLKSCLAFIKSLQRRNNELEYIHFSRDKSVWGRNGLHLEYSPWDDV